MSNRTRCCPASPGKTTARPQPHLVLQQDVVEITSAAGVAGGTVEAS
jgi:hypothetical protein